MIQLVDQPFFIEEEIPPLDLDMPRVFRRPLAPIFTRGRTSVHALISRTHQALRQEDPSSFGRCYGELLAEFQPAIGWAQSCWEYLLSTQGCRFLPRSMNEKLYCRGDYRVFQENDFHRLIHRAFKELLLGFFDQAANAMPLCFERNLKKNFWPTIVRIYQELEQPPDARHRVLTGYSYLRCVPYQFLNDYHHDRVTAAVGTLPLPEREVVELYYLRFYKEEAVVASAKISLHAFRRRRARALRAIAEADPLSRALLIQIERY